MISSNEIDVAQNPNRKRRQVRRSDTMESEPAEEADDNETDTDNYDVVYTASSGGSGGAGGGAGGGGGDGRHRDADAAPGRTLLGRTRSSDNIRE